MCVLCCTSYECGLSPFATQVWSGDAEGAVHNPPSNLIWKNQSWGSGKRTITKLTKNNEVTVTVHGLN